jgi:hypothetical protein
METDVSEVFTASIVRLSVPEGKAMACCQHSPGYKVFGNEAAQKTLRMLLYLS